MFPLAKTFGGFLLPPGLFVLLFLLLAALALRARRRGLLALAVLSAALTWALSTYATARLLVFPLESAALSSRTGDGTGQTPPGAIVVLGGGFLLHSPEAGGGSVLLPESMQRAIKGAQLQRETGLPLLFSGGSPGLGQDGGSEAEAARSFWLSLGLPESKLLSETRSRDTYENAIFTKKILGERQSIYLVTSAWHMPRARAAFERAGFVVTPAPTAYRGDRRPLTPMDFLPNADDLRLTELALHEYLGRLWYFLARH